ncbi:hypothetical protein D1114_20360 [Cereibacter sphaeroides]|jgi:hypothetical protein|uniref:Uncharacterized protein n=1 Tax=Cereibacter sphaeroides TaxID=1063 RepID=A0AAX1UGN7_CERSP|nr:hypothetical protein [Cereibacter sphaeroides]ABN78687.1 hypothetical protein Rsph17029_3597 [Cereibacter sphaeroides ATCC 17029]RHZ91410.1 hypothetical protein D1114_20360 [Cereibacter sphaeroides]
MTRLHATALGLLAMLGATPALAHNPIAECAAAEGRIIDCRGGFSDGSGAAGVTLDVISYDEDILIPGKLGDDSRLQFERPEGEFYILFDAGPGHVVEIDYHDIEGLEH